MGWGSFCHKASGSICKGRCGFSCQCMSCNTGDGCDCSCRWMVVGGLALTAVSLWVAGLAFKERRHWLLVWSGIYAATAILMTAVTYAKGPDPNDIFGCSVPFSLWVGCLFVATMSYYATDHVRQGHYSPSKQERYVYDPSVGEYVPVKPVTGECHII